MMEINTAGFDKKQWDIFYEIKNIEFQREKFKDNAHATYTAGRPFFVSNELGKYTTRLKRLRSGLIEYTASVKNAQDRKK